MPFVVNMTRKRRDTFLYNEQRFNITTHTHSVRHCFCILFVPTRSSRATLNWSTALALVEASIKLPPTSFHNAARRDIEDYSEKVKDLRNSLGIKLCVGLPVRPTDQYRNDCGPSWGLAGDNKKPTNWWGKQNAASPKFDPKNDGGQTALQRFT